MRISAAKARVVVATTLLVPFLVMTACATTSEANSKVTAVDAGAAVSLIASEELVILDLRSYEAYEAARVRGAVHAPRRREDLLDFLGGLDREAAFLVYAQDPKDAARAADLMAAQGFTSVVDGGGFGLLALAGAELEGSESY